MTQDDAAAQAVFDLVDQVVRTHGAFLAAGDRLGEADDLSAARQLVLGALVDEPGSAAEVARRRGLRRQSVRETLGRLERAGLVERAGRVDGRAERYRPTAAGSSAFSSTRTRLGAWALEIGNGVPTTELEQATAVLRRVADASTATST